MNLPTIVDFKTPVTFEDFKGTGLSRVTFEGLTADQQRCLLILREHWSANTGAENFAPFLLSGRPGTGKTTRMIPAFAEMLGLHPLMTAPTNEAVKQLEKSFAAFGVKYTCRTTYQALGLTLVTAGEGRALVQRKIPESTFEHDVIVVDESSMASKASKKGNPDLLMDYLIAMCMPVLYVGDWAQLPPVDCVGSESPAWLQGFSGYELTEVKRNSGDILSYVERVRAVLEDVGNVNKFLPKFSDLPEVHRIPYKSPEITFAQDNLQLARDIVRGEAVILCWTNKSTKFSRVPGVDDYNKYFREMAFGSVASKFKIIVGDQIIFTGMLRIEEGNLVKHLACSFKSLQEGKLKLAKVASVNTRAKVVKVSNIMHWGIACYRVELQLDTGANVEVLVVEEKGEVEYSKKLKFLKETAKTEIDARKKHKAWEAVHTFEDSFLNFKYCYAMTTHRAQGSTLEQVVVQAKNIVQNRDKITRLKCFLVACSRASKKLYIID